PPRNLWEAIPGPADGALGPLAVAIAGGVLAFYSRAWARREPPTGFFRYLEPFLAWVRTEHALVRSAAGWLAGIAGVYAASLSAFGLMQWLGESGGQGAVERGQVCVLAVWGAVSIATVVVGRRLDSIQLRTGGLLLAAATAIQAAT